MKKLHFKIIILVFHVVAFSGVVSAQNLRTNYFLEHSHSRINSNPALLPATGYVTIPGIGDFGAAFSSNGISVNHFIYDIDGENTFFTDDKISTATVLKGLKDDNKINVDFSVGLLSGGWYKGQNFWSASLSFKGTTGLSAPKNLFRFIKESDGSGLEDILINSDNYHIRNTQVDIMSYVEAAAGYGRRINERLTVGGRFKLLGGVAHVDLDYSNISVEDSGNLTWTVANQGTGRVAIRNASPKFSTDEDGNQYISGFDFDGFGLAGFGVGIDVGVNYEVIDNLYISGALLDLGFISWGKGSVTRAVSDREFNFDGFGAAKDGADSQVKDFGDDFMDFLHLQETESDGYTTALATTLNIGAYYRMTNNIVGFGLLSSTRFTRPKAYTELTASVTATASNWFTGSLSYSFIHSKFKSVGLALNFHPRHFNFIIGSDYVVTSWKKGIPQNVKGANVYFGMSVPIARNKAPLKYAQE